jgi:hypothetical protein
MLGDDAANNKRTAIGKLEQRVGQKEIQLMELVRGRFCE